MSLRLKLLLLGLATLVLPWAGCQYVREMETVLREGERESLQAVATTIAASLRGRDDLLFRDPSHASLGERPAPYDVRAWPLEVDPLLDGLSDEWPATIPPVEVTGTGGNRLAIRAGVRERMLFVLADVRDDRLVYDTPPGGSLDPSDFGDRLWLGFDDSNAAERQVFVAAESAGSVRARRVETRDLGREVAVEEPRIAGAWRATRDGYRVELRMPLSMLGSRFGVLIDDRDARGAEAASFGTLRTDDLATRGRLIAPAAGLKAHLEQFVQPGATLRSEEHTSELQSPI